MVDSEGNCNSYEWFIYNQRVIVPISMAKTSMGIEWVRVTAVLPPDEGERLETTTQRLKISKSRVLREGMLNKLDELDELYSKKVDHAKPRHHGEPPPRKYPTASGIGVPLPYVPVTVQKAQPKIAEKVETRFKSYAELLEEVGDDVIQKTLRDDMIRRDIKLHTKSQQEADIAYTAFLAFFKMRTDALKKPEPIPGLPTPEDII